MNKNPLSSAAPASGTRFRNLHAASWSRLLAAIASLLIVSLSLCHAAQSVTLAWNAPSDPSIAGYTLRYGTSGNPSPDINAGNTTTFTVSNLNDLTTYFFTVVAYNASGVESQPSNQISYTTPGQPPSGAFVIGDRVVALQGVAARNGASAAATILQVHASGELGTVIGGPVSANGWTWWNINYDTGSDGWSTQEGYLAKATATPTPTPGGGTTITIGETSTLASPDSGNGNLLVAQQANLTQTATIQSLSFRVTNASGQLRLGIFDATGPNGGPGTKKAETAEITPTVGWNKANVITPVSLPQGTYWLAYLASSNNLAFVKNLSGQGRYYTYPYGPMPATFSTSPTNEVVHWSLFATLTTSGGQVPTYELTVVSGSGSGPYPADAQVPVSAGTPPAGQEFALWTNGDGALATILNNPLNSTTTATMPPHDATIEATYTVATPSGALAIGDRVLALQGVAARNGASTSATILQVHATGESGTVIGGPVSANGWTWWNINYDTGSDGWSTQEGYLAKVP